MEIGQPVASLPPSARSRSKYAAVWTAVETGNGMWVPVTRESTIRRDLLRSAAGSLVNHGKHPRMETRVDSDGVTLWIRLAKVQE